jgi:hypothetical protein
VREQVVRYTARRPEETTLYRLVYHYREQFEYSWEELFSERYGILRDEVLRAYDRYLDCGILKHGCALACCENEHCNHSMLIAFSCKRRGICPSCQAKRGVLFAENLHENVLLCHPHRHLVFSLPKRLRVYFRFDRRLFSHLYRAAWETWGEYVQTVLPRAKPGAVMALHSAGSLLNWHPHIHSIALDGGILPDGTIVALPEVDTALLQEFFAEKVFAFLLEAELIDQDTIDSMKTWEHSGFNFFAGEPIGGDDKDARLFLARYLKKAPLALERLSIDESGTEPVVRYTKPLDDTEQDEMMRNLTPLEFLAELSCHIPRVFEQTTRYFGVYSPRTRGGKRREARFQKLLENNFEPIDSPLPARTPSQSWARCMKLVFEVDPLLCPKCGSQMKIKSFLHSPKEIDRLCKHLGLVSWRAPPEFWHRSQAVEKIWLDDSQDFSQIH